jgi:hypothetical protein
MVVDETNLIAFLEKSLRQMESDKAGAPRN